MTAEPKWRRRKTARPGEIVEAAQAVFAEKGFAAARLEDIAARAGVSKGALYLYFETKTDLFRAVIAEAVTPNIDRLLLAAKDYEGPLDALVTLLFERLSVVVQTAGVGPVAKMVIGESRNFPDLAQVWHDAVVGKALGALTLLVERAQQRGEVRSGDARLFAMQLASPVLMSLLWTEVFVPVGAAPIDIPALMRQHARTMLAGMRPGPEEIHG